VGAVNSRAREHGAPRYRAKLAHELMEPRPVARDMVRGRERPRLSDTGTIMFMWGHPSNWIPSMSQAGLAVKAAVAKANSSPMRTKGIREGSDHNILSPIG
jgi:hypothetical protein